MATGGVADLPWDRDNPDEQGLILNSEFRDVLLNLGPTLIENLRLDKAWSQLLKLNVVSEIEKERMMHNAANPDQVDRLLDFIKRGPTWKFHALMRVVAMTDQSALIQVGVNWDVYQSSTSSNILDTNCAISEDLRKAIRDLCQNCQLTLMKRNLFDLADRPGGTRIDVSECFITIDATFKGDIKTQIQISARDIFRRLGDKQPPNTVLLYGDSGSGKTLYGTDMVYEWCSEMLGGEDGVAPGIMWTTMVFVPARKITGSVEDAIKDCLWCRNQDVLMDHVRTGENVAVVLDAIDEVRDDEVIANISAYVHESHKGRGPKILMTTRTGLCPIESSAFDRFLFFPGFTVHQGHKYIDRFFHMAQFRNEETRKKVLNYAGRHEVKLEPVLTNPLKLHVFCALSSQGRLALQDDDEFSLLQLYLPLEEYLLDRKGVTVSEKEQTAFYQMCLVALMRGYRELPESLLAEFGISDAYRPIFLEKCDRIHGKDEEVTYRFLHESFFEFFASRFTDCLSVKHKKALILRLTSQKSMRNVQRFVIQGLTQLKQHKHDLLQTMVRAMLVLQHESDIPDPQESRKLSPLRRLFRRPTFYSRLRALKDKFKAPQSIDELLKAVQDKRQVNKVKTIWTEINELFENNPGELRSHQFWFRLEANGALDHVAHCLQDIGSEFQKTLTQTTIYYLLPCKEENPVRDTMQIVYPVGGTRWGSLRIHEDGYWGIEAWCAHDVYEVMEQYKVGRAQGEHTKWQETERGVIMYINKHRDVWGTPTDTTWSHDTWERLLHLLTQVCVVTGVCIVVDDTTPLTGLMSALPGVRIVQGQLIEVWHGTVSMDELITCIHRCQNVRVGLVLCWSRIVVPDGEDLDTLRAKRDRLCQMENHTEIDRYKYVLHRNERLECKWVTPRGDVYDWHTQQQTDTTDSDPTD